MHSTYDPSEGEAGNLSTTITSGGSGELAFGLAAPGDIDTVKVTIQFPEGLWGVKTDAHANVGEKGWGHAEFQMFFELYHQ